MGQEIKNEFREAYGRRDLGRLLTFQGRATAKIELAKAMKVFEKSKISYRSDCSTYSSISALQQARLDALKPGKEINCTAQSLEALSKAKEVHEFAEDTVKKEHPYPVDFVRAYLLLSEALIQILLSPVAQQIEPFQIRFYDEYFQQKVALLKVNPGQELVSAERCINEALRRCRKFNMVTHEPDILLGLARLEWAKLLSQQASKELKYIKSIEKTLREAYQIALRSEYRLKLADIHLFCGQVLIESKGQRIFDLNAKAHLKKTKEYAVDVSQFSDLYQSDDSNFYDGIPEYDMLKRGMTQKERIKNGYYMAYRMAHELEKRVKDIEE